MLAERGSRRKIGQNMRKWGPDRAKVAATYDRTTRDDVGIGEVGPLLAADGDRPIRPRLGAAQKGVEECLEPCVRLPVVPGADQHVHGGPVALEQASQHLSAEKSGSARQHRALFVVVHVTYCYPGCLNSP